ncbi:MAG: GNAT family N-acetyltransferase [Sedimentisphaerales bacterium]|nr:GNAT family N-acetyltransferase [Sedimentisphaerales bacterium]
MKHNKLQTNNLELIAATLEHINAELESPEQLASLLNTQVEPGWPPGEYDRNAQEFFCNRMKEDGTSGIGWYIWYAIRQAKNETPSLLIGAGGYFGPPNKDGIVEIGFSVMPSQQNKGYATEIAKALIENAFNDNRVDKVIAHTTNHNKASYKVLEKSGFHYVIKNHESDNILFQRLKQ